MTRLNKYYVLYQTKTQDERRGKSYTHFKRRTLYKPRQSKMVQHGLFILTGRFFLRSQGQLTHPELKVHEFEKGDTLDVITYKS